MAERKDTTGEVPAQQVTPDSDPPIDLEKLVEKVYQLMRTEARLSRVRGDRRSTRR